MKELFTFTFESDKKIFNRKYVFDILFENRASHEKALDWAETTDDITTFKKSMDEKYGYNQVIYNPYSEFYGLYTDQVDHHNYISMVQDWKDFLTQNKIKCGNIIELIEDKAV